MVEPATDIRKVCVLGAGTMGTGIAAQVANAGQQAVLLDIAGPRESPNAAAEKGLARIAQSDPPLLMAPGHIDRIRPGNVRDDLAQIADCDWVVEAVVERLEVKQRLYREVIQHLRPGAVVSSNTSTIPISMLMEGMPETLRRRFCITHFFNPVRYMRLLELVGGADTDDKVLDRLADYCDRALGKGVVRCADTPGFLGNRVGVFALQTAIAETIALGLTIEEADAVFGRPMGIPKTGAFGLYDLIGLDLMADVVRSLCAILPSQDAFQDVGGENPRISAQIEKGFTGRKGKGGFYAVVDGTQVSLDLATGEWRPRKSVRPALAARAEREGVGALIGGDDRLSRFAWNVLAAILSYSATLVPQVTLSAQAIDDAMKLGYNWVRGPFEMIDAIGGAQFAQRLAAEGRPVPEFLAQADGRPFYRVVKERLEVMHWGGEYRPVELQPGAVRFHMLRRILSPVAENDSASLFHLEDGLRLVEFNTKANVLDGDAMAIVAAAARDPGPGIIVHNDGQHFSAGVNLERFLTLIDAGDWNGIDRFLADFQEAVLGLLYCPAPAVGAPSGLAFGGGYEVLAHCDGVVAHGNTVFGLVETLVGLVPGGGGIKETYLRWHARTGSWEQAAWNTFRQVGYGRTASSPELAAELTYFMPGRDEQQMNRDRLLEAARNMVGRLGRDYRPRPRPDFMLAGRAAFREMADFLEMGRAQKRFLDHDVTVSLALAEIVTGGEAAVEGPFDEAAMLARERAAFVRLARTPETRARVAHLLDKGTPLRN